MYYVYLGICPAGAVLTDINQENYRRGKNEVIKFGNLFAGNLGPFKRIR